MRNISKIHVENLSAKLDNKAASYNGNGNSFPTDASTDNNIALQFNVVDLAEKLDVMEDWQF